MTDETDQALVPELQNRSATAWAQVYDRHAEDVFRFIAHLLSGNKATAEEVHQETWLAALTGIHSFDSQRGELRAWIFGIARRQVAANLRRRRTPSVADQNGQPNHIDASDERALLPEDVLQAVERSDAVLAALAELGTEARGVLLGKYVEGHSVNELAEQFCRTPKAIESLLSRARGRLRSLLAWYFDHDPLSKESEP